MLVVLGSVTPPGRLRRALGEAVERGREEGMEADLLDLAEHVVHFADGGAPEAAGDDAVLVIESIADADCLVLATPVYRGSMTGALKNLLDLTPVAALEGKAIGLIAMGASDHHSLGPDRHLRDVLAFFGAVCCPVSAYLTGRDFDDGVPSAEAADRLDRLLLDVSSMAGALGGLPPRALRPLAAGIKPQPHRA